MNQFPQRYKEEEIAPLREEVMRFFSQDAVDTLELQFKVMAEFYGLIPLHKVYEILTVHYGEKISEEAFLAFCEYERHNPKYFYYEIFGEEEYYESDAPASKPMDRLLVFESLIQFEDDYETLCRLKAGKPWYILPKELSCEEEKEAWQDQNDEAMQAFRKWLAEHTSVSKRMLDNIMSDMRIVLIHEDVSYSMILDTIQRYRVTLSLEKTKKLIPYYTALQNKTRMPCNNGFTPEEAEALRAEYGFTSDTHFVRDLVLDEAEERERSEKMERTTRAMSNFSNLMRQLTEKPVKLQKPISKNAKCPCGSGKKYKRCCGK